ncbi:MAG: sugar ABC transporter permease [bacterium]|jgi:arabinogalactan oligomer/maltooligosaccharide transport system permease protein|nr:sugar ABC transporter permease [Coprothermobacterota bacterium]
MAGFFSRARGDSPFKRILIHLLLIFACLVAIYPVLRVLTVSLRPGGSVFSMDLSMIPADATLENYTQILFQSDFWNWLKNSLIVSLSTALVSLILAAPAGYAFSRFKFVGKQPGLVFLLVTQLFPATMLLLPLYIMLIKLSLINTFLGLVFCYMSISLPFSIWILKGYFDTIPIDLEEAAWIDGSTPMGAFFRVILPLSTPALSITALFSFMTAWSEYIIARIVLQNQGLFTWPLGTVTLQGAYYTNWGPFSAAALLISIPVVVLFMATSRYLVSGLTLGAVKG